HAYRCARQAPLKWTRLVLNHRPFSQEQVRAGGKPPGSLARHSPCCTKSPGGVALIQFLLNREMRSEQTLDPNTTVLQYLREHLHKTGTKEGCASGDCGACTVVVGELDGTRLRYRTLNACLTFVSALHGKQLITVEDLKNQGQLHSVQQAMVDCHGSQCGYCTPGFVMSLFALQKNSAATGADPVATHE